MAVEPSVRPKRIELKKSEGTRYEEGFAGEAITPGMLLERVSRYSDPNAVASETIDKVQKHSTSGGRGEVMVALEDALQGKTISDAYAADNPVSMIMALPGDELFLFLAAEENISDGDLLVSNGDGHFKGVTAGTGDSEWVFAEALEDLDLTGASAAHIKARILPQSTV